MAYPEPIPVLKGKKAKEFKKRLKNFKLTKEQKQFYRDGTQEYHDRHSHRIKCLWEGCDGVINLEDDLFVDFPTDRVLEIGWSLHTIMCPKCMNPVGMFEIWPSVWCGEKGDSITDPKTGKTVILPKKNQKKAMNKYLKERSKFPVVKRRGKNDERRT